MAKFRNSGIMIKVKKFLASFHQSGLYHTFTFQVTISIFTKDKLLTSTKGIVFYTAYIKMAAGTNWCRIILQNFGNNIKSLHDEPQW